MAHVYPPLNDDTVVEDFVGASCTLHAINSRALDWPPSIGYTPIPYHIANRHTLHIQQSATEAACDDRLRALPHWHVPPGPRDQQALPWLVIFPYHPIIETWGTAHTNSGYPIHFVPTDEVDSDSNPELFNLLPESLQNLWGNILISTRYRYILYHTKRHIRVKSAVFISQRFNNTTPYFTNLRGRTPTSPLPTPSAELTTQCQAFLSRCRDVLLGRRLAFNLEGYNGWVTANEAPVIRYVPDNQQPTYTATPTPETPLEASASAPSTVPDTPAAPIPPIARPDPVPSMPTLPPSAPSASTPNQTVSPRADIASDVVSAPSDHPTTSPRETPAPMDIDPVARPHSTISLDLTSLGAPPSRPSTPRPITNTTKDRLIAPLILPPRPPPPTILSDIPTDAPVSITNCYAGLFARLPSLWQLYEAPHSSAQALYNYLFAPEQPLEAASPTSPAHPPGTEDAPMGSGEPAPEPASVTPPAGAPPPDPTPFASLLDRFVDIPASFADPNERRTPTVPSQSLPDPLTGNADPPVKITPLLQYLQKHLTPHLQAQIGTNTRSCFVTLIIGPSTDCRVGPALHSHLVCAAVAPPTEDYSVLFIPSDLIHDFNCPTEWEPLLLYIAASLCYPDLPFLVTTPDYVAGALCTAQGLRDLFKSSCPHVFMSTADSLVSPHLFLHLPPHAPLSLDAMDTGTEQTTTQTFRFRSPDEITQLIQLTASDQLSSTASNRASLLDPVLQDMHFPLYCTPYYGYSLLTLSSFK